MASPWNSFHLKRKAHSLSRSSTDQSWNPFRHVSWDDRKPKRVGTWDGGQLESQRNNQLEGDGEKLTHASTEPGTTRNLARDLSTAETMRDGDSRKRSISSPTDGVDDSDLTHRPIVEEPESMLRNRRPDEDTANFNTTRQPPVDEEDNKKKEKPKKQGIIRKVEPKEPYTVANQLQRTFLNSWINVLLIAAPVGIALNFAKVNGIIIFVVNFIAIIPLAAMLSFATEEIALRTGEVLGGLINATFGNAVELIVAVLALADGNEVIVKTSLIGSILSNLLLVMGFCFFFGGLRRREQYFNVTVAQTAASLLALAVASVIVPTVFDSIDETDNPERVAKLSRGTALILLIVYGAYLTFQLKTQHEVFTEEGQKVAAKPWSSSAVHTGAVKHGLAMPGALLGGVSDEGATDRMSKMMMNPRRLEEEEDEEEEAPTLHFLVALATLLIATVIIALCAEFMVSSIDDVTKGGGISQEFVGLILLPIVGNAAEHATAVTVAIKDKMDLAIGVAVGSSMQVALFLIPLLVVIGWGMDNNDMNLSFDLFQVATMFVAVLLTNYLIGDGKSHWLEGWLLICLYAIIATCSWFYPNIDQNSE